MPATAAELIGLADRWLQRNRSQRHLPRTLYLVGGLSDETGACFDRLAALGRQTFDNWDEYATRVNFPISNDFPVESARAGDPMRTFLDFGDYLRELIGQKYPDNASNVGEFDVVAHSMGGLDAFAALTPVPSGATRPVDPPQLARAFNFIACDTPFRGIPSADLRAAQPDMEIGHRRDQCNAIAINSPQLALLGTRIREFTARVERLKCIAADTAIYVEVPLNSSNLLADTASFSSRDDWQRTRERLRYRAALIPGSVHSGGNGLTTSSIGIVEVFTTLLAEQW